MATNILIVIGTPLAGSLNHSLAHAYADSARQAGAEVRIVDLATDPIPAHPRHINDLRMPREGDAPLDADVARYVADLEWADHVSLFYPQWWGTYPAAFKAYLDAVLLAGFAHRYVGKRGWEKMLRGRTGRVFTTMDSPGWWNLAWYWQAADVSVRHATLWYVGIKVVGIKRFAMVRHTDVATRERWIAATAKLGERDASRGPARGVVRTEPALAGSVATH
ncbi:MAG: NAD(P)H dehydrogenase [Actinobacteria bacterium HGW-Actinobacteria-4]|nr:MAG: NAD(P)H dehydrogenase [Actinobacteria bacterium HGW-Actinobacteria-4]